MKKIWNDMAYRVKKKHVYKYDSTTREERFFSGLIAKFDFRREVAPNARAPVRKRIRELAKDTKCSFTGPVFSMFLDEGNFHSTYGYVSRGFRGLSFKLEYYGFSDIPSSQMPHLPLIHHYILTGEKPHKV